MTKELVIADNSNLIIQLEEDLAQLDEVVVIGYGTQRKKEITGAVSVVGSKTIEALKPTKNRASPSRSSGGCKYNDQLWNTRWRFYN